MVIDGHRHIDASSRPILREMDRLGIDRTVLVGVGVRDLSVVTVRDSIVFRSGLLLKTLGTWRARRIVRSRKLRETLLAEPANDRVRDAVARHPDRFSGFAFINPESPRAGDEIRRCLDAGLQGIKLALLQYPTDLEGPNMAAICATAAQRRLPLFVHQGLTRASSDLSRIVKRFPGVVFIVAHAGVQYFESVCRLAATHANVYVDTSSYFVTRRKLRRLCRTVGARKLVFGSDVPVMAETPREGMERIMELPVPDGDKRRILGENLEAVLAGREGHEA